MTCPPTGDDMKIHETDNDTLEQNIHSMYASAIALGDTIASRDWYTKAYDDCKVVADSQGVPFETFVGVVAALSPQMAWYYNLREAVRLVNGMTVRSYPANRAKGKRILAGEKPLDVLGGNKVRSFYANILSKGKDDSAVTIDTWALRIAIGETKGHANGITDKQYARLRTAYQNVARAIGILATELQAVTWVHIRNIAKRPLDGRQMTLGL